MGKSCCIGALTPRCATGVFVFTADGKRSGSWPKKVPTLRLKAAPVKGTEEFRLGGMQKVIHGTVVANWLLLCGSHFLRPPKRKKTNVLSLLSLVACYLLKFGTFLLFRTLPLCSPVLLM